MSAWNRRLGRAAGSLQAAYDRVRKPPPPLWLPATSWSDAQAHLRRVQLAEQRNWRAAAGRERAALASELEYLARQITTLVNACHAKPSGGVPSLRLLYEELMGTEAEFGAVEFTESMISVTTESIVLEDVALGPFQIRLHLDRMDMETPYTVVALEPNPAASCSDTTHPHVNGERLCPGEGRSAINAALAEGRLFDFFTIVDRILHHYTQGSAFVELDRWYGVPCHDCDCSVNEEDASSCYGCTEQLCDDCRIPCGGCSESCCSGCIDRCARCEEYSCSGCLVRCRSCRRDVCDGCREDDLCETCREELEEEYAEEAETAETPDKSAESTI